MATQCARDVQRALRRHRLTRAQARALGRTNQEVTSLEDAALARARLAKFGALDTDKGVAVIGDDYLLRRRSDVLSPADALAQMRAYAAKHADNPAQFWRRYLKGLPCSWPCQPAVSFDGPTGLAVSCEFNARFKPSHSVGDIQREVKRVAQALGIPMPKLPKGALQPDSECKKARKDDDDEERVCNKNARGRKVVLTVAQRVMSEVDAPYIMKSFKGALMWHTVGGGKTCAAVAVASHFLRQGWRVIWASTAALKAAPLCRALFEDVCHTLDDDFFKRVGAQSHSARQQWLERAFHVVSYSTLSNAGHAAGHSKARTWLAQARAAQTRAGFKPGHDMLWRTLVIMDEPHKIWETKGIEAASWAHIAHAFHESYRASGEDSVRVLLMDATPMMDSPGQLLTMLNALQPRRELRMPTDMAGLRRAGYVDNNGLTASGAAHVTELAKGVVSYVNLASDRTKFAYPVKATLHPIALSPSAMTKVRECNKMVHKRLCAEAAGVATNMPAKYSKAELDKRQKDSFPLLARLADHMHKLDAADRARYGHAFKHVVFTNVPNITHATNVLNALRAAGYTEVKPGSTSTHTNGVVLLSGSGVDAEERKRVQKFFNSPGNVHGERARVIILDGRFREGIDLFDVRHFHLLQPLNELEERQALGRALRMCGSTHLPRGDNIWQVLVHQYTAVDANSGKTAEELAGVQQALDAFHVIGQLEYVAARAAFDRAVMTAYNVEMPPQDFAVKHPLALEHLPCTPEVGGQCPADQPEKHKVRGLVCCRAKKVPKEKAPRKPRNATGKAKAPKSPCARYKAQAVNGVCPAGTKAVHKVAADGTQVVCCAAKSARKLKPRAAL